MRGTSEHILNGCPVFLEGGMYKLRHDQSLEETGSVLKVIIKHASEILIPTSPLSKFHSFVKERGEVLALTVKPQKMNSCSCQ